MHYTILFFKKNYAIVRMSFKDLLRFITSSAFFLGSNAVTPAPNKSETPGAYSGYASYGWIFGYVDQKDADGKTNKDYKDFYLLSVKPGANAYYLERYEGVPKKALESNGSTTSLAAYGNIYSYIGSEWVENKSKEKTDDNGKTYYEIGSKNDEYYIPGVNDGKWDVSITQKTEGEWIVKIDDTTVATFKPAEVGNRNINTIKGSRCKYGLTKDEKIKYADADFVCGGTTVYGMATYGTQLNATYTVDKENASTVILGNYNIKSNSEYLLY